MLDREFLAFHKPTGVTTHRSNAEQLGFVEYQSRRLAQKLYVVHRLDRDTSGLLLCATSPESARDLSDLFAKRQVRKRYQFLTSGSFKSSEIEHTSSIRKVGERFVSQTDCTPNAKTSFHLLAKVGDFSLVEARPLSGRTHQIRLHAADCGIPILGDELYGGHPFPRLMLHACELQFEFSGQQVVEVSAVPPWFTDVDVLRSTTRVQAQIELDRREALFELSADHTNAYRLLHTGVPGLRCDKFGEYLWFYEYSADLREVQPAIEQVLERTQAAGYKVQQMANRGQAPEPAERSAWLLPDQWQCRENGVSYEVKRAQGASAGLFLDQRLNRAFVLGHAQNKRVLNLFAYTGGFSVCAALGGAREVVSVDTSKASLAWAQENFQLNGLEISDYEFWSADVRQFLAGAARRKREFDLIICDPPSFARSKQGIFRLESELPELIRLLCAVLAKGGQILFATNFEKWSETQLQDLLSKALPDHLQHFERQRGDWDFELPTEQPSMKSFLIGHD